MSLSGSNSKITKLPYKSTISPRSSSMSRSRMISSASPLNINYGSHLPLTAIAPIKSMSGTSIRDYREKEKKELIELNDRFANYVERVRFLEIQNKQLRNETEALKGRLGSDGSKIKDMYETELQQARDVIASTGKDKMLLEAKVQKAVDDATFYRERYDNLISIHQDDLSKLHTMANEMSENEATINLMNRRMKDLDDQLNYYKSESQKLLQEVQRLSSDLYDEISNRLQIQNEKQSLEEELNFLKQVHSQELEDLQAFNQKDYSLDPTNFFRHELANAIKDIREEYENLHQQQRVDMENWYRVRVNNAIKEVESKRLVDLGSRKPRDDEVKALQQQIFAYRKENIAYKQKNDEMASKINTLESIVNDERDNKKKDIKDRDETIVELQMKLNGLLEEYDDLLSNNNNLNTEITVYRKLLDGSDSSEGLKQIVQDIEIRANQEWANRGASFIKDDKSDSKSKAVTFQTEIADRPLYSFQTIWRSDINCSRVNEANAHPIIEDINSSDDNLLICENNKENDILPTFDDHPQESTYDQLTVVETTSDHLQNEDDHDVQASRKELLCNSIQQSLNTINTSAKELIYVNSPACEVNLPSTGDMIDSNSEKELQNLKSHDASICESKNILSTSAICNHTINDLTLTSISNKEDSMISNSSDKEDDEYLQPLKQSQTDNIINGWKCRFTAKIVEVTNYEIDEDVLNVSNDLCEGTKALVDFEVKNMTSTSSTSNSSRTSA